MAGSFRHICGPGLAFRMELIENLGDAEEALEECFKVIMDLADHDKQTINMTLAHLGYGMVD